ncbi:hypothetical protein BCR34DRAFT_581108 [Clohesyomyces aquaticus]|uniref:HTH psq-type domain-containing protein n=1 Tax=Clohesyomyces aquaticus TaxID=1231657 RepID=A0A1Y1Y355_9PLEO|nr:hypothetical protein BCR34DRAFT_581108 [Clohesyomyces aquaticus]
MTHHRAHVPTERTRTPFFTEISTPIISTTMEGIEAALEALESLKVGEDFKYSEYAKQFSCSQSTLLKRHRGLQEARATTLANGQLLNNAQEQQLI